MTQGVVIDFSVLARNDIADILDHSAERFGQSARRRYALLLEIAFEDLGLDPLRAGTQERPELGDGIRIYHIRHSRKRAGESDGAVGAPRHLIAFRRPSPDRLLIVRVLHDAMDMARHLSPDDEPGES